MKRMEYTMTWFIENYSYCCQKRDEKLISPQFYAYGLENSAWCLWLYPRGWLDVRMGDISLFLKRSEDDGPENISLHVELSFLGSDGSALKPLNFEQTFKRGASWGYTKFRKMADVLKRQKVDYLPQDTLRVRCKMWMKDGDIRKVGQGFARTRIGIEQISFMHVVESFSSLEPNQNNTFNVAFSAKEDYLISNIYFSSSLCCDGRLIVEITPSGNETVLSKCKIFLLDAAGNVEKCGEKDNRFDETGNDIKQLPLSLTRKVILDRKHEYLPDDKLTLLCECTFSTGEKYEKIERILQEIPSDALNQINNDAEKLSSCPSVIDDFKALYDSQFLSDVELKTKTKSFRAHKNLLCARSPVFKAMICHDMKEKYTDCIQVDDLENDTVENFLHFLYSDNLETTHWDDAIKLYYAADKYAIKKLKAMCSSILIDNLDTSNAVELLLLADAHNDVYLHKVVHDLILQHEEEVYSTDEWVNLIETNPILVSKTMCLKYIRNNKIL